MAQVRKRELHATKNNLMIASKEPGSVKEATRGRAFSFPVNTYFIRSGKNAPKGKLWDRYQSQIRNLKKLRAFKEEPAQRSKELNSTGRSHRKMKEFNSPTEEEQSNIALTLKNTKQWDEIQAKWKQTVKVRRSTIDNIKDASLLRVLHMWPFYTISGAPHLVEIDFEHLISEADKLTQKWQHFLTVAPALFQTRIKDPVAKQNLAEFLERKTELTTDTISFQAMHLLHAVLKPSSTFIKNKPKKYSISDSQAAFTLIVKDSFDIENVLLAKREICLKNETCLHPIIVAVGDHFNLKEFYVALANVKWQFDTYLAALEYCFKLYYVMNVPFPKECSLVWTFVQEYFYGINTEEPEILPTIQTFIGDINALVHTLK